MRARLMLCICIWLFAWGLSAQNQMDLMTTIYGEFNGDKFGWQMVAMDYNGDGFDDLIVLSEKWNETGVYSDSNFKGKVYFYWGGPDGLSTNPDFVLEGQQRGDYSSDTNNAPGLCNAGDMNGDGIDDLAIARSYDGASGTRKSLNIHLGRSVPSTTPDYIFTIPETAIFPRFLGDINNDGKDDLAINGYCFSRYLPFCYIWTDIESDPILFRTNIFDGKFYLNGVGDVDNDGYSDSFMTTPLSYLSYYVNAILYYGDSLASMTDSLVISESLYRGTTNARPLGDINGDGFGDFIGLFDYDYHYIWMGSTELDSIPDLQLSYNTNDHDMTRFARGAQVYAVYGDMNGDGYSDFVCSDSGANGWNGQAGLWLGGPNVNATVDLVLDPPPDWEFRNYGHAKTVGDFNGDGFYDIALSAPWWREGGGPWPGRVFVYAGNIQLQDTTVSNDDPLSPPPKSLEGVINVYPNPVRVNGTGITISTDGEAYTRSGNYSYQLYNLRGQKIMQGSISSVELANRQFELQITGLNAGIYQIVMLYEGHSINTKRIIVY